MGFEELLALWESAEAAARDGDRDIARAFAGYRQERTEAARARLSQALAGRDRCRAALRSLARDVQTWLADAAAARNIPSRARSARRMQPESS
jgi:hypothetical protein